MVTWPEAFGGRGLDLIQWLIFEEEYFRAGGPNRANQNGIFLLGPTIMEFGTEEQKQRFLTPMAQGRSDLGAGLVRTRRGQRHGGDPVEGGAGRRSLRHHRPEDLEQPRGFCRLGLRHLPHRSGQQAPQGADLHPVRSEHPGITRRPIRQLHGDTGFAELFFDEVRVPVENCLAGEGEGWNVAMATPGSNAG
jgi:alkylation response protein AidB-like acyl-CoA dehydrogenase